MQRVVLHTSVLVSGVRSRAGASHVVLRIVAARALIPIATPALFLEYEDVPKRPEQRAISGLSIKQADDLLAALASAIEPTLVHFTWRPQLLDAGDEMVLDAAVNGRADALITHNVGDFAAAGARFGLPVLRPSELLERMGPWVLTL